MRNEATLNEWKELYEIGLKIKNLKPWEHFWDMDIITIIFSEDEPPYYCSIMGRAGECFGIGTYVGAEDMDGFYNIAENQDIPASQLVRYQRGLFSYFGNRNELTSKELNVVKSLGYKFRGKDQWLYYRSYKPPYVPYMLDKEEVGILTKVYVQLYEAISDYLNLELKVDFEHGETLLRKCRKNTWFTATAPLLVDEMPFLHPSLSDDLLVAKLKKRPKLQTELEFDIAYLYGSIADKSFDRPAIPRVALIMDVNSGMVVNQYLPAPDEEDAQVFIGMMVDFIMEHGKPKAVYVRDLYSVNLLMDLCERTDIDLEISPRLNVIDFFVEMLFSENGLGL